MKTSLLDAVHANSRARWCALHDFRIAPEIAICDNRRQPVHVHDVVNLGLHRNGHALTSMSTSSIMAPSLATPPHALVCQPVAQSGRLARPCETAGAWVGTPLR